MASEQFEIVWTTEAEDNLDALYDFILRRWTHKEALRMLLAVRECEHVLAEYPEAFKESTVRAGCRLALAHPNLTIVYRIETEKIVILAVFDNRSKDSFRS